MNDLDILFRTPTCIALVMGMAVCAGLALTIRKDTKALRIVRAATPFVLVAVVLSPWMMSIPHHTGHGTKYIDLSYHLFLRLVVSLFAGSASAVLLRDRRLRVKIVSGGALALSLFVAVMMAKDLWRTNSHLRESQSRTSESS